MVCPRPLCLGTTPLPPPTPLIWISCFKRIAAVAYPLPAWTWACPTARWATARWATPTSAQAGWYSRTCPGSHWTSKRGGSSRIPPMCPPWMPARKRALPCISWACSATAEFIPISSTCSPCWTWPRRGDSPRYTSTASWTGGTCRPPPARAMWSGFRPSFRSWAWAGSPRSWGGTTPWTGTAAGSGWNGPMPLWYTLTLPSRTTPPQRWPCPMSAASPTSSWSPWCVWRTPPSAKGIL